MNITTLQSVNSDLIKKTAESVFSKTEQKTSTDLFGSMLDAAIKNVNETNNLIEDANTEQIKLSLGETENTHDLTNALQKASTALQYTIVVRDKLLDAYKEIMNMEI